MALFFIDLADTVALTIYFPATGSMAYAVKQNRCQLCSLENVRDVLVIGFCLFFFFFFNFRLYSSSSPVMRRPTTKFRPTDQYDVNRIVWFVAGDVVGRTIADFPRILSQLVTKKRLMSCWQRRQVVEMANSSCLECLTILMTLSEYCLNPPDSFILAFFLIALSFSWRSW